MELKRKDGTVDRDGHEAIAPTPERAVEVMEQRGYVEKARVVEVLYE